MDEDADVCVCVCDIVFDKLLNFAGFHNFILDID